MLDNLKKSLSSKLSRFGKRLSKSVNPVRFVIFVYALMALSIILTYYYAWIILWFAGKESLPSLMALIKEFTGPSLVAFVTFVALSTIDSDNDGIPDSVDKKDDREEQDKQEVSIHRGHRKELEK